MIQSNKYQFKQSQSSLQYNMLLNHMSLHQSSQSNMPLNHLFPRHTPPHLNIPPHHYMLLDLPSQLMEYPLFMEYPLLKEDQINPLPPRILMYFLIYIFSRLLKYLPLLKYQGIINPNSQRAFWTDFLNEV